MNATTRTEGAVSPVVGVILMVAVTVLLSAAIGAVVFDLGQSPSDSDASSSGIRVQSTQSAGADAVELTVISSPSELTYQVDGGPKQTLGTSGATAKLTAGIDYAPGETITVFAGETLVQSIETDATATAVLPPNLISDWRFDDSSTGSTAIDSEEVKNGSILGASYVTGPNGGGALSYDGSDDYVDVGNQSEYEFGTNESFSISTWYYVPSSSSNAYYMADTWNWESGGWFFRAYPSGGIHFRADDANGRVLQVDEGTDDANTSLASADEWHHAVAVVNRSENSITMYVDGQFVNKSTTDNFGDLASNQNPLTFGYQSHNGIYSQGQQARLRFYGQPLSEIEVETLYNDGS